MGEPARRRVLLVTGLVQGVGFRPFVYRTATAQLLGGWVRNDTRGVTICVEGPDRALTRFEQELRERLPSLARIDSCDVIAEEPIEHWSTTFEIRESAAANGSGALVTPDSHVCGDCVRELFDPTDRRNGYPLINCTNCGPRYSIVRAVPYDRPLTTMADFAMCAACHTEYHSPADRRFHAQPNACWVCGPQVRLLAPDGTDLGHADPIKTAAEMLGAGKILAVKALGGYHLMADAAAVTAVLTLRDRKNRPSKPFAMLARDADSVARHAFVDEHERLLLQSPGRPIVLLRARPDARLAEAIAPRSATLGFMLPATPLQHLLLTNGSNVLVATSANASGEPMAHTETEALTVLSGVVDGFLVHNRDIHMRVDDSIARVVHSEIAPKVTFLRRARGYAPDPIPAPFAVPPVLALGAELKNTVCLGAGTSLYPSQHIGDLSSVGNQRFFEQTIDHLRGLFGITPKYVAHDLHPDFYSTRYAARCAEVTRVGVQHHHAHMASCMADNGLDCPVIGVVFDGTGYGTDGTIWGGEFLVGDYRGFERAGHLECFRLPGGDQAVRQPWRVAAALLAQHGLPLDVLADRDPFELEVLTKMATRQINSPTTSSVGRLFDAVSAMLGGCAQVEYEAQAAIELEQLIAWDHTPVEPWPLRLSTARDMIVVGHEPWIRALLDEIDQPRAVLSRRFHESVVHAVTEVCLRLHRTHGLSDVVLSGGVFLNQHLLIRTERELTDRGLRVHTHHRTPAGDGGLAVGQAMVAAAQHRERR